MGADLPEVDARSSIADLISNERGISRRTVLETAGAVFVLAAGGLVWRAWDRGVLGAAEGPAYEPWHGWQAEPATGPIGLVRAAILAANPHNSQPWLFRFGPSTIDVFADRSRNLGAMDPFLEEMYVGIGCALENLLLAAPAAGYSARAQLMPDASTPVHVARVVLAGGSRSESLLYRLIDKRHTNRGPYDSDRTLERATLDELGRLAGREPDVEVVWLTSTAERRRFATLTVEATEAIVNDQEQSRDSAEWFRFDADAVQRHRDGITYDALTMPAWMRMAAKLFPTPSRASADAKWLETTREVHVATASAFGILTVRSGEDLAQRVRCGRAWQRMHLWAASRGLAMQPLNQLPERRNRERVLGLEPRFGDALQQLAGHVGRYALLTFRVGIPLREALPSPRRSVEEVLVDGSGGGTHRR